MHFEKLSQALAYDPTTPFPTITVASIVGLNADGDISTSLVIRDNVSGTVSIVSDTVGAERGCGAQRRRQAKGDLV